MTPDLPAICRVDDIEDGESTAAMIDRGDKRWPIMLIRRGQNVFAYVNSCPHIGAPLDWKPGQFLTRDRTEILCAVHGARFVIEDGSCVAGPCVGRGLVAVEIVIQDGEIFAPEPTAKPAPEDRPATP